LRRTLGRHRANRARRRSERMTMVARATALDRQSTRSTTRNIFTGRYERRVIPVAGHFQSRERPDAVVTAPPPKYDASATIAS
jgi:hypothetical protein